MKCRTEWLFSLMLLTSLLPECCAADNGLGHQIPAAEYNTLVEFYHSMGGTNWITQTGWLDPDAPTWFGISISGVQYDSSGNVTVRGNVTSISLDGNKLVGTIPGSIGNLSQLSYLRAAFNQIGGEIPSSIGNLQKLWLLYLHFNQLSGSIPTEIGNLKNLQYLYLRQNLLNGIIPTVLGNLAQLRLCGLGANQLSGEIPSEFGNFTFLVGLDLNDNLLTGNIPASLGKLASLQTFQAQNNKFSGVIPDIFSNCQSLKAFRLDGNLFIGGIPSSLTVLTNVQCINLSGNQLQGDVPIIAGPLIDPSSIDTDQFPLGLNISDNCLEVTPGTQSRSNIDLMISQGKTVVYSQNCQDLAKPTGLTIVPVFDGSITNHPQASKIVDAIGSALKIYSECFSDPLIVHIGFSAQSSGLANSTYTYVYGISYSSYLAALMAHATTPYDALAIANLPVGPLNPLNGAALMRVGWPNARTLGLAGDPPAGQNDGEVRLNLDLMNFDRESIDPSKFDLMTMVMHEVDEVLGIYSALGGENGTTPTMDYIWPLDLFRYADTRNGVRSFDMHQDTKSYFSLDGTNFLARFNQTSPDRDFGDWYGWTAGEIPQIQDSATLNGSVANLGIEKIVLDAIGFTLRPLAVNPLISDQAVKGEFFSFSWQAIPPFKYRIQSSANLGLGAWTDVGQIVIATNTIMATSDSSFGKASIFYRVLLLP